MGKKYMSMQEELAARRAASAAASEPSRPNDPSKPRSSAETQGDNPLDDFRRNVEAQGAGLKQRFLNPSAESRQRKENKRAGAARNAQNRGDAYGHFQAASPAEKKFSFKMLFVILAITFAIIIFAFGATSYEFQRILDRHNIPVPTGTFDPTETDPTETYPTASDPTKTFPTRPPSGRNGSITERTSLADIEEYVNAHTTGTPDESALFGKPFSGITSHCTKTGMTDSWYISDGRLYFWPKHPLSDDPAEDIEQWMQFSVAIRNILRESNLEDTPIVIGLRNADTWDLKMLLIDGDPIFLSREYNTGAY